MSVFRNGSGKAINLAASLILVCVFASLPAFCCLLPLARRRWHTHQPGTAHDRHLRPGDLHRSGCALRQWHLFVGRDRDRRAGVVPHQARHSRAVASDRLKRGDRSLRRSIGVVAYSEQKSTYCPLHGLRGVLPGIYRPALTRYPAGFRLRPVHAAYPAAHDAGGAFAVCAVSGEHIPAVAWCCLAAFACYGIATTHDYSAALRARIAAAHQLGVGRERVSVGFEYDGWTELERSEYVSVVQYADLFADDHAKGLWFWFWNHTPHLQPDYVVLNWNSPESARGGELKVDFRAWMPPFQRSAVVWRRSDLTGALQTARMAAMFR